LDGSIKVWGPGSTGLVSTPPAGGGFAQVDGGLAFAVALRDDGSIKAWGDDTWKQVSNTPSGNGFIAVCAGDAHGVALRADGSLASWGYSLATTGMPTTRKYVAISAAADYSMAVRDDGVVVVWGNNPFGDEISRLGGTHCQAVAAGYLGCLALKTDGSIVSSSWGTSKWGFDQPETPDHGDFTAIACGLDFGAGLTGDPVDPVVSDDFNYGCMGVLWKLQGTGLTRTNHRLEFQASATNAALSTKCVSNNWTIDTDKSFSFRIELYHDLAIMGHSSLSVVLTPDINNVDKECIEFGLSSGTTQQCNSGALPTNIGPCFWRRVVTGGMVDDQYAARCQNGAVLYLTYDADSDKLYLSYSGYENAWETVCNVMQGRWNSKPITLCLAARSQSTAIASGQSYMDEFVMEEGHLIQTKLSNVYHFEDTTWKMGFYTISEAENAKLMADPKWTFKDVAFQAATAPVSSFLKPVYRFWSPVTHAHYYTNNEAEKTSIVMDQGSSWAFEGVAFYAYPLYTPVFHRPDSIPVYWFSNGPISTQLLTTNVNASSTGVFEGIAFYAYPAPPK
jgi:hypothetical protein